jgi:hypothetical protein
MTEKYDPKAKRTINSTTVGGATLTVGDRVRYTGSSPCFVGKAGKLTKLKREWVSARSLSRAGFGGDEPGYAITAFVLWDGTPASGPYAHPQSCRPDELAPA